MLIKILLLLGWMSSMPLKAKASPSSDHHSEVSSLGIRCTPSNFHSLRHRHIGIGPRHIQHQLDKTRRLSKRKLSKDTKILLRGAGHATFYYEKDGPGESVSSFL